MHLSVVVLGQQCREGVRAAGEDAREAVRVVGDEGQQLLGAAGEGARREDLDPGGELVLPVVHPLGDAERKRGAAARNARHRLRANAPLLLQQDLVGRAEESQLQFGARQFEVQRGQCGKRLTPQGPGEIGRARVGVGGVQGREHGSAPQAHKERERGPLRLGRTGDYGPDQTGRPVSGGCSQGVRGAALVL